MFYRPQLGMGAIVGTPAERSAVTTMGMRAGVIGVGAWGVLVACVSAGHLVAALRPLDRRQRPHPRVRLDADHVKTALIAYGSRGDTQPLVCSIFADQPFWGARCRALGIGDTIPFAKLDAQQLSVGLRSVLEPQVASRAAEVGRRMTEEDGVGQAVEYLEREFLSGSPDPKVSTRVGLAA